MWLIAIKKCYRLTVLVKSKTSQQWICSCSHRWPSAPVAMLKLKKQLFSSIERFKCVTVSWSITYITQLLNRSVAPTPTSNPCVKTAGTLWWVLCLLSKNSLQKQLIVFWLFQWVGDLWPALRKFKAAWLSHGKSFNVKPVRSQQLI